MPDSTNEAAISCEGGCTCGNIRYRMFGPPLIVHGCHCRWCQRQSGSAFAINALIEADRVELLSGDVEEITVPSPSGAGQTIARCPKCKVAVWSNYLVMRGGIGELVKFIRVGTLDEPDLHPPDIHIYTSTQQPWFALPENSRSVLEYYNTEAEWTPESLERRMILIAAANEAKS